MRPTFEKTVDVLVKAYMNDTLDAGNCKLCAVGNIISRGNPSYDFYSTGISWYRAIGLNTEMNPNGTPDYNHPDIVNTGYTAEDLLRIERIFMDRDGLRDESDTFSALMAVVDVLADIHGIDLEAKESAKLLFVKA